MSTLPLPPLGPRTYEGLGPSQEKFSREAYEKVIALIKRVHGEGPIDRFQLQWYTDCDLDGIEEFKEFGPRPRNGALCTILGDFDDYGALAFDSKVPSYNLAPDEKVEAVLGRMAQFGLFQEA